MQLRNGAVGPRLRQAQIQSFVQTGGGVQGAGSAKRDAIGVAHFLHLQPAPRHRGPHVQFLQHVQQGFIVSVRVGVGNGETKVVGGGGGVREDKCGETSCGGRGTEW